MVGGIWSATRLAMKPIIRIDGLGKQYRLGARRQSYGMLRDVLVNAVLAPVGWLRGRHRPRGESVWALRNVDLEVMPGEAMGIIGGNGAGKSTLLKLLSRVTCPTEGRIQLWGRIGSLLEVGTGFHPELTGRDNIYLNAAILGLRRAEIARKFDEIVAFAEVEKFLDTPVKFYSSGMYMRLAFAVAAHLDPEILVVDEVLAVGDAAFQKKCLGKMEAVAKGGRTVLFVSHNMAAIEVLCQRCVLLTQGRLDGVGSPREIAAKYLAQARPQESSTIDLASAPGRTAGSLPVMTEVALFSVAETPISAVRMGDPLTVRVGFRAPSGPVRPLVGVVVKTSLGTPLFAVNNDYACRYGFDGSFSEGAVTCRFQDLPLMPGAYVIDLHFGEPNAHADLDIVREAISFEVLAADVFGTGKLPPPECGPIFWPATWEIHAERVDNVAR